MKKLPGQKSEPSGSLLCSGRTVCSAHMAVKELLYWAHLLTNLIKVTNSIKAVTNLI